MEQVTELVASGAMGVVVLTAIYFGYKAATVSIISLTIYKAVKLIVVAFSSRSLEARIAAEMGLKTPLTAGEQAAVLKAVRGIGDVGK